jgi:hypothetical protein
MRDTPLIFLGLYRLYRHSGHSRRASLRQAWQRITHRL